MATGAGLGGLVPAAMVVVAVVTALRARSKRRSGKPVADEDVEQRQRAAAEMERRMASYLAQRDMGDRVVGPEDEETRQ